MARFDRNRRSRRSDEPKPEWIPKSDIGRLVKSGQITSVEEIFSMGKPILESGIIDHLYPDMAEDTLEVKSTQRMTGNGRKMQFRAIVLVGDKKGHFGIGAGKSEEVKPAIESAIKDAKRNIISVPFGCGSWESGAGFRNSIPIAVNGRAGSVRVLLKPAPRGVGLAANDVVKKVLAAAGVKDIWSFSRGHTRSIYNTAMATANALEQLNTMKLSKGWGGETKPETGKQPEKVSS
ncbi:MAG: 30S ribosomal protein S5 [Candidatus Micrarchaeota archaeon]|nr:30S ribosomal protein S5 [Candidatus Micrarchaeota archaeon]